MQGLTTDLIWPALALLFAGAFLGLWNNDRARLQLMGFALGFFALFLAMSLHIAFPSLNTATITPILHVLACLSVIAIAWGAAMRLGQQIPLIGMLVITAISSALLFVAMNAGNEEVTLLVQNGSSGLLFGIAAVTLWFARPMNFLDRVLIWTMTSIAAFGLLRPAVLMLGDVEIGEIVQRQADSNVISVIAMAALTAILGIALIAIAIIEALEMRHRANRTDPISGFLDRSTFDRECNVALQNAHQLGLPATLVIFEIDRFDALRSEFGEETSNLMLRDLSDILRACQRDGDIVGRFEGNQIGVLLVGMNADSGLKLAMQLREDVKRKWIEMVTGMMNVTLSCAVWESRTRQSYNSVFDLTRASLKKAKSIGSNCTFVNGEEIKSTELGHAETEQISAHG